MQSHRQTSFVLIGRGLDEEHRDCDEVNLGSSRSLKLAVQADSFWLLRVLVGSDLERQQVLCLQPWSLQKIHASIRRTAHEEILEMSREQTVRLPKFDAGEQMSTQLQLYQTLPRLTSGDSGCAWAPQEGRSPRYQAGYPVRVALLQIQPQ